MAPARQLRNRMVPTFLLAAGAAASLTACTLPDESTSTAESPTTVTSPEASPSPSYEVRAEVGDQKVLAVAGVDYPDGSTWVGPDGGLSFEADNRLVASSGCRTAELVLTWNDAADAIDPVLVATTPGPCDDVSTTFFELLDRVDAVTWDEHSLTLVSGRDRTLVFTPAVVGPAVTPQG